MAEDMTYEPVTDVTTLRRTAQEANQYALCMEDKANELATRVQELERALAQADSNMVALAARNAELRARLDAVWDYARYYRAAMWELEQEDWRGEVLDLGEWIADGKPRAGTLQKTKRDWREVQP